MNNEQFKAVISIYIADIINEIIKKTNYKEDIAIKKFVESKTYELLVDEKTKVWHLSSMAVCEMYLSEEKGKLKIPEVF